MNFSFTDQVNHSLKVRSPEVSAGKSVVTKLNLRKSGKIGVFLDVPLNQLSLCSDTVAVVFCRIGSLVDIFQRKTKIDCNTLLHFMQPPF